MANVLLLIASAQRRGAEVFASQLAEQLERVGHTATLLALVPSVGSSLLDVEVAGRSRWDPAGMARLRAAARRHDVVIGSGSITLIAGALASASAQRPFIYRNIGDPAAWGSVRAADQRIGTPLRRAAGVAALYDRGRTELIDRYRLHPDRVRVISNGVPDDGYGPTDATGAQTARCDLGLDASLSWVGVVGALSSEKNVATAITAIGPHPGLGLVIAGDGPERSALERLAATTAPGRVRFLGALDDVHPVLAAIETLVIPSVTEGIPAVAIEASLSALPVVASDVGGMSEVVLNGATGYLVPPGDTDALQHAVGDALTNRSALGAAARDHCMAHFTMGRVGQQWSDLIDCVLDGSSSRVGGRRPTPGR